MNDDTIEVPELELCGHFTTHAAPVQAEGTVAGHAFYFRSRHEEWSFAVALSPEIDPADVCFPDQGFYREAPYGATRSFAASYMPLEKARQIITDCATEFFRGRTA